MGDQCRDRPFGRPILTLTRHDAGEESGTAEGMLFAVGPRAGSRTSRDNMGGQATSAFI